MCGPGTIAKEQVSRLGSEGRNESVAEKKGDKDENEWYGWDLEER